MNESINYREFSERATQTHMSQQIEELEERAFVCEYVKCDNTESEIFVKLLGWEDDKLACSKLKANWYSSKPNGRLFCVLKWCYQKGYFNK